MTPDAIVRAGLPDGVSVAVLGQVDSTNRVLLEHFVHRHAVLADAQTAGRGRRGRHWIAASGAGIWLSYGYRFAAEAHALAPLGLAAGVVVAEALAVEGLALKWPNDLVVDDRKLGGILVELRAGTQRQAVIGVGINTRLPNGVTRVGDASGVPPQPWTDLAGLGVPACRITRAASLIAALDRGCAEFDAHGFAPFAGRWRALDALCGRRVRVMNDRRGDPEGWTGTAHGVTAAGALRLRRPDGTIIPVVAGEVSVRVN